MGRSKTKQPQLRIPAALIRPSDASTVSLSKQRAQGMPGARRTRSLACK